MTKRDKAILVTLKALGNSARTLDIWKACDHRYSIGGIFVSIEALEDSGHVTTSNEGGKLIARLTGHGLAEARMNLK